MSIILIMYVLAYHSINFTMLDVLPHRGALSNQLYLCSLPAHIRSVGEEPRQVLLRVFGATTQVGLRLCLQSLTAGINCSQ